MPAEKLLNKNEDSIEAWDIFVKTGEIKKELIREVIYTSWKKSRKHIKDPVRPVKPEMLSTEELNKRYDEFKFLLNAAKPFMRSLYKIVGDTGLNVRLTDKDGYIISFLGRDNLADAYGNQSLLKGWRVKEENIGTNAIGLALSTGRPIQVLGGEHYLRQLHNWTTSACPMRNEKNQIIGVLSVTGPYEKVHPHTLGMVVAASEAIENELKLENINKRLIRNNKHLFAIMESISEGLIGIDNKGIVRDINGFAKNLISIKEDDIIGRSVGEVLSFKNYKFVLEALESGEKHIEKEIYFKNNTGKRVYCIVALTPIHDCENDIIEGMLLTFRKSKTIHNLVNKMVGAEAIFTFDDIIGESQAISDAKDLAQKGAKGNTTVLLQGESGTGKELFAQAIHNESPRRNKPFVFLNCGAIPRDLVASELFGYVEGAFTGAKRGGHPGKFEFADEGTIFLDEIGDMPLDTQVNLLRVLETKSIVRVGGHNVIPIDVRVIAATHKDLKAEVEKGNFREDLYYRLNVMPIRTPSLRERREDIKYFVDYFLEKFGGKMNKKMGHVSESFYKYLKNYDWPGNVRELQNIIQLVVNMVEDGEAITYKHLPSYMKKSNLSSKIGLSNELLSLEEIEKIAIIKTLEELKGNIALASKVLGIGRTTLYRKIEKYNLSYIVD